LVVIPVTPVVVTQALIPPLRTTCNGAVAELVLFQQVRNPQAFYIQEVFE